jgi:DNA-binding GntR family transcriptional regulator
VVTWHSATRNDIESSAPDRLVVYSQYAGARRVTSGRQRAYEYLRDAVLTDPAVSGQFISEQDVAARVGVSRTPVREALLLLAAEDLVTLIPQKGAYVAALSPRETAELIELRGVLERFAAQRALADRTVPVAALRAVLDRQREVRADPDSRAFIDLDHEFHTTLVAAAGNALLTRQYQGLRVRQVRAGLAALARTHARQDAVLVEHEAILTALAAGDADRATAAITAHLAATRTALLGLPS